MKHLLLLTVGLSLAWALQDQSRVPVQQDFSPEQVMLRVSEQGRGLPHTSKHFPGLYHLMVS